MRFGPPARILAVAGVLALALVGLVVRENIARDQGTEVRLALAGYDPRSLLQGHFVRFQLSEELPGAACPPGSQSLPFGRTAWVALRRAGSRHRVSGAAVTRADAARLGDLTVRGWATCGLSSRAMANRVAAEAAGASAPSTPEVVVVAANLGVDRIHLDQAQAEAIEAELRRARPEGGPPGYAVLSIGRDGKARVKGLIVGDRRVDLDWF